MENVIAPPPAKQNTPVMHQKLENKFKKILMNKETGKISLNMHIEASD